MGLEVGLQADIAKAAIHAEWTTAAGIDLTIGKTAADWEHIDGRGLSNLVSIGAEQVLRANRDRVFLSKRIAHVEINRQRGSGKWPQNEADTIIGCVSRLKRHRTIMARNTAGDRENPFLNLVSGHEVRGHVLQV
jgi:hypothetical protein